MTDLPMWLQVVLLIFGIVGGTVLLAWARGGHWRK